MLDLTGCTDVGEYGDRGLREVGGNLTKLRELHFADARRVEDSGILSITMGAGSTGTFQYLQIALLDRNRKYIASGGGCRELEVLTLSGCENVSRKGLRSMMRYLQALRRLTLRGCRKMTDADVEDSLRSAAMQLNAESASSSSPVLSVPTSSVSPQKKQKSRGSNESKAISSLSISQRNQLDLDGMVGRLQVFPALTSLHLLDCPQLSDRGVAAFCRQIGGQLLQLSLVDCRGLTDYCGMVIGGLCPRLRELDLTGCGQFGDAAVTAVASRVSCLTMLKLDGNKRVTTRGLLTHIGKTVFYDASKMNFC